MRRGDVGGYHADDDQGHAPRVHDRATSPDVDVVHPHDDASRNDDDLDRAPVHDHSTHRSGPGEDQTGASIAGPVRRPELRDRAGAGPSEGP
jgi:hypothetical protein